MDIINKTILLVDDELRILELVEGILKDAGFKNVYCANSMRSALSLYKELSPHIIILDIMLPDGSGFEIIEEVRKTSNIPVLFLSALADIEKQYEGFNLGADDYMVKPFLPKELVLRIKAILNRAYPEISNLVQLHSCKLDFEKALVLKNNEEIPLTAKEYTILKVLYDNKDKIVTIDGILDYVWGEASYGYENSLMAHIRKIREKIEEVPSNPVSLLTFKGLGYKLKVNL